MCRILLLLTVLVGVSWTPSEGVTPFRKCTPEIPAPELVQVNDCEAYPCIIKAGSVSNMTVKFTTINQTQSATAQLTVYVNGDSIPFSLPEDNANVCSHLINSTKCPLNAGDSATYNLSIPVDEGLPDVYVATEVALVDDKENCMICFVTDIRVQAKARSPNRNAENE